MFKKPVVILLTIIVLAVGSGVYLWEKNKGVISQLEDMERSIFSELQDNSPEPKAGIGKNAESPTDILQKPDQPTETTNKPAEALKQPSETTNQPAETTNGAENKVSATDRAQVIALVSRKLSSADIKRLKRLAEGGVTPQEKKEAKEIVLSKFSSDEVNRLKEIYRKYK